jgi:ribosome-associated toxin RatA of RatAB toxin-antitoxin module
MHAEQIIDIDAPAATIYAIAQDVARWPEILPHYRFVKVLRESDDMRIVEMAARRDWIPVRWTALQTLDPKTPRIEFKHLSGWTKGMEVAWIFEPRRHGTRVKIVHELKRPAHRFVVEWFERAVVGDFFIQSIAGRTLARMKQLSEAEHG